MRAPGYGRLNDAVREAMAMAARHEALLLDPVYTGKAMAGLVAHVRAGRIAAGSRVLFLHTGGLPALFAAPHGCGSRRLAWPKASFRPVHTARSNPTTRTIHPLSLVNSASLQIGPQQSKTRSGAANP